ncbi:MAG: aspartate kinase [Candidatus Altiarchaeales archaeon]|nr:MAG: aspartate kinase [Candidatus Altiarchaeales archaeon]
MNQPVCRLLKVKMIIMKFGGTSVGSAKEILRVTDLIAGESRKKVVVVSAMAGITDRLEEIAKNIINLPATVVEKEVEKSYREILSFHVSTAKKAIKDKKIQKEVVKEITELANELRITLLGIGYLEDLSPKSLDYILSFGERLSVLILTGALKSRGINAKSLTGYEAGIITNSRFGSARPIFKKIDKSIKKKLNPLLDKGILPVVTGFIAADEDARITTLGRGGSDFTASLLARYLEAEEVQIWTDVDGILSTDPRIVPNTSLISTISYVEAMDLAYFGAKVIHPMMIEPAMDANIPVRIKNTFNPKSEGTLIVREQKEVEGIIKAVTMTRDVVIVNLKGVGMAETPNIAASVFTLLGDHNINIIMISGSSESNLSFVIKKSDLANTVNLLNTGFMANCIRNLELIEDSCIITIVGAGMRGTKGIAAKIFQTIADEDVNIIMIAQGSSEVNISLMVKESDGEKVLKALHKRFIEK